jgi:hypothetical protein
MGHLLHIIGNLCFVCSVFSVKRLFPDLFYDIIMQLVKVTVI